MKTKYYIDKKSFCGRAAVTAAVLAVFFRLIGSIGSWSNPDYFKFGILLPISACVFFAASVMLLGKRAFWTSAAGVLAGGAFFVFKVIKDSILEDGFAIHSNGFFAKDPDLNKVWAVIFIAVYVIITAVYVLTVFSAIKTKWIATVLFAIPLGLHLYYDYVTLVNNAQITPLGMMNELSVLSMLCGMFFACFGLKKAYKVISGNVVTPPAPGDQLSEKKTENNTETSDNISASSIESSEKADEEITETGENKVISMPQNTENIPESGIVNSAEEAVWIKDEPSSEENMQTAEEEKMVSAEELLNDLPVSGPLTLDPIIPERKDEQGESDAEPENILKTPQGKDEPERLDAIAPKKGLAKFFKKQ